MRNQIPDHSTDSSPRILIIKVFITVNFLRTNITFACPQGYCWILSEQLFELMALSIGGNGYAFGNSGQP